MVDAIQARSTIPLADSQTLEGSQKGSVLHSAKDEAMALDATQRNRDDFESYLNGTSVTFVPKSEAGVVYDTAAAIAANSPYSQAASKLPL